MKTPSIKFLFFSMIVVFAFLARLSHAELKSLDELVWEKRIIIIFNEGSENIYVGQIKKLHSHIEDRDIVWFVMTKNNLQTNYSAKIHPDFLSRLTRYKNANHSLTLIGKDGGVKLRSKNVNFNEIFALIDSMPMRQQEMRYRQ